MLTDFQNSFIDRFSSNFTTNALLIFPPHLNGVTTLPCEISKNCHAQHLSLWSMKQPVMQNSATQNNY